jgi:hypothetical protein
LSQLPNGVSFSGSLLLASAFFLSGYCHKFLLKAEGRWRALSAGVGVAYALILILPELEAHRLTVARSAIGTALSTEQRIYLWALAGFVAFAGLSRLRSAPENAPRRMALLYPGVMAGYALYVILIGYLLVRREDASLLSLGLYVFAIALHLFIVDGELAERFKARYEPKGRALLACSVLMGWGLGIAEASPDAFISRLFAFLAGGVLITSGRAEARAEEGRRFWWFVGGAAAYATLLMLV